MLMEQIPVVLFNAYRFIVAADAVFTALKRVDAVVVVCVENFNADSAVLEQEGK